jgi:hypothetical protein
MSNRWWGCVPCPTLRISDSRGNHLMISIESPSDPPPHKLRWYQFSLRSIFVVMTLVALGLGLYIKYVKQAGEKQARITTFGECIRNFSNQSRWMKKPAIDLGCSFHSSNDGNGEEIHGHGEYEYSIRNSTGNEPSECVAALMEYLEKKSSLPRNWRKSRKI